MHHAEGDARLISEGKLESLLTWWRTTARDNHGEPLFCIHGAHSHPPCMECAQGR